MDLLKQDFVWNTLAAVYSSCSPVPSIRVYHMSFVFAVTVRSDKS